MKLLEFQCLLMVIKIVNLVPLNEVNTTSEMSINQTDKLHPIVSQSSPESNLIAAVALNPSPIINDPDNNLLMEEGDYNKSSLEDPENKRPYYVVNYPYIYGPNRLVPRDIRVNISTIGEAEQAQPNTQRNDRLKIDLICKPASGTQFDYRLIGQLGTCRFNFDSTINFDDITSDQPTNFTIYLEDPKNLSRKTGFKLTSSAPSTRSTVHDIQDETSTNGHQVTLSQPVTIVDYPSDHYISHRQPNYKYYNDRGSSQRHFHNNLYDNDEVRLQPKPKLKVSVIYQGRLGMGFPAAVPSRRVDLNKMLEDFREDQQSKLKIQSSSPSSVEMTTRENINIWGYWNQFVFPPHDKCPATLTQRQLPTDDSLVEKRDDSDNPEVDSVEGHQKRLAQVGQMTEDTDTDLGATLPSDGLVDSGDYRPDQLATEAINGTEAVCNCSELHEKGIPCVHN